MSTKSEDLSPSAPNRSTDAAERVDLNQMFALIDGILPFEACLYYQVVPLSIQGSRLNLGMVDPNDRTAADYVRRLVSYINCSIVSLKISSDWHRDTLSQYLSHTAKIQQKGSPPDASSQATDNRALPAPKVNPPPDIQSTLVVDSPESTADDPPLPAPKVNPPPDIQSTLVVDSPEVLLDELKSVSGGSQSQPQTAKSSFAKASPSVPQRTRTAASPSKLPKANLQRPPNPGNVEPLRLQVDSTYRTSPIKSLASLPPKKLMQALLSRVLEQGIGRLYFERLVNKGRVLWSKDGVPQSILDDLQPAVFQGVINELKRLTHLSLISVSSPKQVEIERLYEGSRLLLRFRVTPGSYGEEGTLQVLRGAALKFHQQQQIDRLGRDALGIAHKLQQQLNTIRDRTHQDFDLSINQVDALPAIIEMLKQMETQVEDLLSTQEPDTVAKVKRKRSRDA
ncbi:MAG: hypothetical protein AAF215_21335 [Cyanobacteria bacterium P01_A01_bin.123]